MPGYVEVAHVVGDEELTVTSPYDIVVCPARLLG